MPFRIGYVKYLNTLPLVEGLEALADVELVAAVPAKLGPMLASGELDVALASVIDAARATQPLTLIPSGMIGCDGPTLTVRLFSAVPFDQITQVHADTESHTSVALLSILMARRYNTRPRLVDFDARAQMPHEPAANQAISALDWPQAMLLIGDKVATDPPPDSRYPHQLDLGAAWHDWTGLPFVYATWMCRAADSSSDRIAAIADLLDRQRCRNLMRLDWIIDRFAAQRGWQTELARTYVGSLLRYDVGPREREALERFFAESAELGLAPRQSPQWLNAVHAAHISQAAARC